MKTISDLIHKLYDEAPTFVHLLQNLKSQNPQISWYPFRSMDKVHLISMVGNYFDSVDISFLNHRPKVLDVGAADGDLSFLFEKVGCEVVAIDNPASNYNKCTAIRSMHNFLGSKVILIEKDIDYDFTIDGQYDLIFFLDILYHLRNPLGCLISLNQLGRYMIFTTRIFECAPVNLSTLDKLKNKLFSPWENLNQYHVSNQPYAYLLAPFEAASNDPTNYWIFTETALERLLNRSGWRILKKSYFGYGGNDSSPSDSRKDKRVVCLCERVEGYEHLKFGHVISLQQIND